MDNPYLNVVNKKLRALRKKFERIVTLESQVREGKILNEEQVSELSGEFISHICSMIDCLHELGFDTK